MCVRVCFCWNSNGHLTNVKAQLKQRWNEIFQKYFIWRMWRAIHLSINTTPIQGHETKPAISIYILLKRNETNERKQKTTATQQNTSITIAPTIKFWKQSGHQKGEYRKWSAYAHTDTQTNTHQTFRLTCTMSSRSIFRLLPVSLCWFEQRISVQAHCVALHSKTPYTLHTEHVWRWRHRTCDF